MPGTHKAMGLISYRALPDWQKKWWNSDEETISEACLLPDAMGWKWTKEKFKKYKKLLLFEKKLIPHGPPDRDFNHAWITGEEHDQENFLLLLRYYTRKFSQALDARNYKLSVDFAGILAHLIQEACFPSHAIPNPHFYKYFQQPEGIVPDYHSAIDNLPVKKHTCALSLMGTTPEEISYRLWIELEKQMLSLKKNLPELMEVINSGRKKKLVEFIQASAGIACKLAADAWYSCISLSAGRIRKQDTAALLGLSLCDVVPYFTHPGGEYRTGPGNYLLEKGKKRPLSILSGKAIKPVQRGLGITSFVSCKYLIDSDIFPVFTCKAGISPVGWKLKTKKTGVRLVVETDKDINRECMPDINYNNTRKLFEQELIAGEILNLNVKLGNAKTLIISAATSPLNISGQNIYLFPNIAIAEPALKKH